jgi:hypothetical protein
VETAVLHKGSTKLKFISAAAHRNVSASNELMGIIMSNDIPERDWKKLRALKDAALNIACERIFQNITKLIESRGAESHKYYLKLWKVMQEEDKEISLMFDDLKRSTAIFKLTMWKKKEFSLVKILKS